MDEATARKLIEDYLAGQSSDADFDRALDYLKTAPQISPDLSALFRDLDLPGGLTHEEAQELMPYYLEPLARAQLSPQERRRFVAHLSQCPVCAGIYLELRGFEAEVRRSRQAEQTANMSLLLPLPWPQLQPFLQSLNQTTKLSSYSITFRPAFRETNPDLLMAEYTVLFEDSLGDAAPAFLEASVTAWRSGPATCDLQVELADRLGRGRQAGQTIHLSYNGQQFSLKTDPKGEALFPGLAIEKLASLRLKLEIKPA